MTTPTEEIASTRPNGWFRTLWDRNRRVVLVALAAGALMFVVGLLLSGGDDPASAPGVGAALAPGSGAAGARITSGGPRSLVLSEEARLLAGVEVTTVERMHVAFELRMVGKIGYDERRVGTTTAWVSGRIDKLFVDFTGVKVRKGAPMVSLYSPELYVAQKELLEALRSAKRMEKSGMASIREATLGTVDAARERLVLWGLTPAQVAAVEATGKANHHVTIKAPLAGTVVETNAVEGTYVEVGTLIYTIVDLRHLWVMLDAYESDLSWLSVGDEVSFETETFSGEAFNGKVIFIDPVLADKTRTVKVRLEVHNADGRLKPGMFVRAVLRAELGAPASADVDPEHAGHTPGGPSAKTPLGAHKSADAPLVIPASAALITGKRAVVYVAVGEGGGTFEGREVRLGSRAGDHYVVLEGLEEGERVVSSGAFMIDSSLQILAKPSMMNPEGGGPAPGHSHGGDKKPADEGAPGAHEGKH